MPAHLPIDRRNGLLAWLAFIVLGASLLLTGCIQLGPPSHPSSSGDPVIAWLRRHAHHLTTVEPGGSDADLQPLVSMMGSADIVGLGEATHGTHEFIEMKARLMEFLVTQLHFTTFLTLRTG